MKLKKSFVSLIFFCLFWEFHSLFISNESAGKKKILPFKSLNQTGQFNAGDYNIYDLSQIIKNTLQDFKSLNELQKIETQLDTQLKDQDPQYVQVFLIFVF